MDLASLGPHHLTTVEKTLFYMATSEVLPLLDKQNSKSLVLMGIEVGCSAGAIHIPDHLMGRFVVTCSCLRAEYDPLAVRAETEGNENSLAKHGTLLNKRLGNITI